MPSSDICETGGDQLPDPSPSAGVGGVSQAKGDSDFLERYIAALDDLVEAMVFLEIETPRGNDDHEQRHKMHNMKRACIRKLNACRRDTGHLGTVLAPLTAEEAEKITDLGESLLTLSNLMASAKACSINHPILRVSNASPELKEEWVKHDRTVLQMRRWLRAAAWRANRQVGPLNNPTPSA